MISMKCKYALKAVLYIARNQQCNNNQGFNSVQISENARIPKKFLESILLELRNAKILKSKRGKNGGYSLNRSLNEITYSEIIRIIDGPIALLPCVSLNYHAECIDCDYNNCEIRRVFIKVRDNTLSVLSKSLGLLS